MDGWMESTEFSNHGVNIKTVSTSCYRYRFRIECR